MPSPFPGVDPYVEASGYWNDLAVGFYCYASEALHGVISEEYVTRIERADYLVRVAGALEETRDR